MMSFPGPALEALPFHRAARRALIAAGLAYVGAVFGYTAIRRALGPRVGWVALADDLEPWAYVPAPILLGLGALLRSSRLSWAAAGLAAAFGLRWGSRWVFLGEA